MRKTIDYRYKNDELENVAHFIDKNVNLLKILLKSLSCFSYDVNDYRKTRIHVRTQMHIPTHKRTNMFPNNTAQVGLDTKSIFKRFLTGFNS